MNKMQRPPVESEKIFASDVTKDLISKIYKQLIQLNKNKKNNTKMGRKPKQTFFQRHTDGQAAYKKDAQNH